MSRFNTQPPEGGWLSQTAPVITADGFNTQPPEGGWVVFMTKDGKCLLFQHTAARRRLGQRHSDDVEDVAFQHTAARRRLAAACRITR